MNLGLQCQMLRNPVATNEFYHLHSPVSGSNLVAGTTIRYEIGTATDPTESDSDGDGILDGYDPFPRDASSAYFGQCEEWVRANFTNAEEILDVGYANWVDEQVGVGLENGLYKLTVSVPYAPQTPVAFTVGDLVVVATNSGEYVFVLEKGVNYPLSVSSSEADNFVWTAVDDIPRPLMMSLQDTPSSELMWTIGGNDLVLERPFWNESGFLRWNPKLLGSPNISRIGPVETRCVFTANLVDYRYARSAIFRWSGGDADIHILNPDDRETIIEVVHMPSWRSMVISVSTDVFGQTLTSTLEGLVVGENETPQIHLDLSVPQAVILKEENDSADLLVPMSVSCSCDVPTNGTYVFSCTSDGGLVKLWDTRDKTHLESYHQSWPASEDRAYSAFVEGIEKSLSLGDVTITLAYKDASGVTRSSVTKTLTVVKVGNVILPGEPEGGLVVLRGTSVAMEVECEPEGAGMLVSSTWNTRRLKCDGTCTGWDTVAENLFGCSALYTPQAGGIYQVRSLVSLYNLPMVNLERRFVWSEDENRTTGLKRAGDVKAFGVCDEEWQIDLRGSAKAFLGSLQYLEHAALSAQYGFSGIPSGEFMYKCNMFVAHRAVESSLTVPANHGRLFRSYPPLANEWYNTDFVIPRWAVFLGDCPQPGFIAATHGDDWGHVGIVDFDGMGISAGQKNVNRNMNACDLEVTHRYYQEVQL